MARNRFDQDEEIKQKLNFKIFGKLKKYISPYKKYLISGVCLVFITAFLELLPPYFISIVIDKYLPQGDFASLIVLSGVLLLSMGLIWLALDRRVHVTHVMALSVIRDLRKDVFEHLQRLPFSYFDSRPHGKILVRVVNYVNSVCQLLANGIIQMFSDILKLIAILCFMFAMNVKFTLICLSMVPVFLIVLTVLRRSHTRAWRKYSAKQSNLNAYIAESIAGIKITKSFAREDKNAEIFSDLCHENNKSWMKAQYIQHIIPRLVGLLSKTSLVLVYILGGMQVLSGEIGVGLLIAFATYTSNFWVPISNFSTLYNELTNCGAYLERVFELLDEPLVINDLADAFDIGSVNGDVSFQNVTFRYEQDLANVLENVSFDVKQGQSIALVGPTGAGKSTIVNLISRFYDINDGIITIDGKDIKHATLKSLRHNMGIMLQDSFLFSGTIRDNIRYSKLDATDEEIIEAAKKVCAHEFITELENGYDTMVSENGSTLSIGQKQLIAFARTVLADPKILILDEATSSIDTQTEEMLQKSLEAMLEGRTSFIIAHRLSTIKNSDKIMYVSEKGVLESGTHEELLSLKGKYYDLYMAQYKFLEQNA